MASKSIRNPPKLVDCKSYEAYTKLINIWRIATDLPKEKQGAALLLSLEGEAQSAALRVPEDELKSDEGINKVIAELDKLYQKDKTTLKFRALEDLENFKKSKTMTMAQYILQFETKLDKTKILGITWPDDIIAFRLLKNANLSEQDHRLAKATVGSLEYEKVKEKLNSIFGETESETPCSSVKFEELNIAYTIHMTMMMKMMQMYSMEITNKDQIRITITTTNFAINTTIKATTTKIRCETITRITINKASLKTNITTKMFPTETHPDKTLTHQFNKVDHHNQETLETQDILNKTVEDLQQVVNEEILETM